MSKIKVLFTSLLLLIGLVPILPVAAQVGTTDSQSVETLMVSEWDEAQMDTISAKNKDGKKDKEKNKFEKLSINQSFLFSLGINLIAVVLLILLVYYPHNKNTEQIFTYMLFNLVIFIITFVLNEVKISMGAAFGLFAVFSMLRYRTASITMKDMTYLFIFIALGLINAVHLRYDVMLVLNSIVVFVTFILDSDILYKQEHSKNVQYDNIEMIKPENYTLLLEDLRQRTGLDINRFEIKRVNFLKDSARITVYYKEARKGGFIKKHSNRKEEHGS